MWMPTVTREKCSSEGILERVRAWGEEHGAAPGGRGEGGRQRGGWQGGQGQVFEDGKGRAPSVLVGCWEGVMMEQSVDPAGSVAWGGRRAGKPQGACRCSQQGWTQDQRCSPPAPQLPGKPGLLQMKTPPHPGLTPWCSPCPSPVSWVTVRGQVRGHAPLQASLIPRHHGLHPQVPRGAILGCSQGPGVWGLPGSTEYGSEPSGQLLSAGRTHAWSSWAPQAPNPTGRGCPLSAM